MMVVAVVPATEIATIPAIVRATSTSPIDFPFLGESSLFTPTHTPMMIPSPLDAPRRAVWNPGIYFARLPFLPHMDLRVEAVSSEGLIKDFGPYHFFTNSQYLDGNTNKGFMVGNAIGRDSRAIEGRSGYWFSARSRIEAGYRQNKVGTLFLPGGGTITDGFVTGYFAIGQHWQADIFTQYERFLIPSYLSGSHHNTSGWLQLKWYPDLHMHR